MAMGTRSWNLEKYTLIFSDFLAQLQNIVVQITRSKNYMFSTKG